MPRIDDRGVLPPFALALVIASLGLGACGDSGLDPQDVTSGVEDAFTAADAPPDVTPVGIPGTTVSMDFTRSGGSLFDAPFPSDDLIDATGHADLSLLDPAGIPIVEQLVDIAQSETDGFGTTSTIYFTMSGAIGVDLPDVHGSLADASVVRLVDVDPGSPERLRRFPVDARFTADGGPFGAPNQLSLLPLQGVPLRPMTRYAAVITRGVVDVDGEGLGVPLELAQIIAGVRPEGLDQVTFEAYADAVAAVAEDGIDPDQLAGLAVFTTWDPVGGFDRAVEAALADPLPSVSGAFALDDVFDGYCVYSATIDMPIFQHGEPPFDDGGGGWILDEAGVPKPAGVETARIVATVPRAATPDAGYPVVVFIRTGGGGDRPLVDRGPHPVAGGPPAEAGTGPAMHFAAAGWGAVSVDGPHGGLRNVTGADEQFLMFNVTNPLAMRDNVRQSALEVVLTAHLLDDVTVDASDCPGVGGAIGWDTDHMALMGHSMGATIAPLSLAVEPRFRGAILSGAGGSWLMNIIHKESPIAVKPAAELLLGYLNIGRSLHEHDPAVALLQWAGEAADPPVYAHRIVREPGDAAPRHVLMLQGIVDTYILPPIANALSLALGLDLAGAALDVDHPDLGAHAPLESLLPLVGRETVALPAAGNLDGTTAIVVQHAEDGVEDGHEVAFQQPLAQAQYRCFLASLLTDGPPEVVAASCP